MRYFISFTAAGSKRDQEPLHMRIWIEYPYLEAANKHLGLILHKIDGITSASVSATIAGPPGTTSINLRRAIQWTWAQLLPIVLSAIQKNLAISTTMKKVADIPCNK